MKRNLIVLSVLLLFLIAVLAAISFLTRDQTATAAPVATAAPEVFASSISGGCYIAAEDVCKIHLDEFTVNVDDGNNERLVEFQLHANGRLIYHFSTSSQSSYRPVGDYTPSFVMEDFAATCGETYTVNLLARDEGDENFLNAAITGQFVCPSAVP